MPKKTSTKQELKPPPRRRQPDSTEPVLFTAPFGAYDEPGTHTTLGGPGHYHANVRCPRCGHAQDINPVPDDGMVAYDCACGVPLVVLIENWESDLIP